MKRKERTSNFSVSLGMIVHAKVDNKSGVVKYNIKYRDAYGREHTQWSDWMRFDGYGLGDSIPVKTVSVPGTCGLITVMTEVNGHPQKPVEPRAIAMMLTCVGSLLVGYHIGREHD
jgi:hypothetical protein